jgi:hypothetical protein
VLGCFECVKRNFERVEARHQCRQEFEGMLRSLKILWVDSEWVRQNGW